MSEESPTSFSQSQSSFSVLRDIPSLLPSKSNQSNQETVKTPDDKSQASIDTCESVSEQMVLTPEKFLEEQERLFIRLANQEISLLDSYNSEKTENMSISLNMTPSSSVSSKISDNLQSVSEMSENVSMISDTKTDESQANDYSQSDLPLPKHLCYYRPDEAECDNASNQEGRLAVSAETSVSSGNSQRIDQKVECFNFGNDEASGSAKEIGLPRDFMPRPETIRSNERILSQILGMDLTEMDNDKVKMGFLSDKNS